MYGLLVSSGLAPATVTADDAFGLLLLPHAPRIISGARASAVVATRRRGLIDLIRPGTPRGGSDRTSVGGMSVAGSFSERQGSPGERYHHPRRPPHHPLEQGSEGFKCAKAGARAARR